jgi:aspartyl/asparaginyl beta-hydroxylase (cupin superfamily)
MDAPDPRFPFVATLEAAWRELLEEFHTLDPAGFIGMPSQEMYEGAWSIYPLAIGPWAHEFPGLDLDRNRRGAPVAMRTLAQIPGVELAGFQRIEPGTRLKVHTDFRDDDVIRCHLGLRLHADERRWWEEGRARVMDVRMPHRAANPGPGPRVTFVLDVRLPFIVPTGTLPDWTPADAAERAAGGEISLADAQRGWRSDRF